MFLSHAQTIRKRIFIIARCDGLPIVWPTPTHGPGRESPYRTTAENIDWSLPSVSIFASKAQARKQGVKRPLKDPTLARIAKGVVRFVLASDKPYIVGARQTASAGSDFIERAAAMIQTGYGERPGQEPRVLDLGRPLGTIMAGGVKHAIVEAGVHRMAEASVVVAIDNQSSGDGCARDVGLPLSTIVKENRHAIAQATLMALPAVNAAAFIAQQNLDAVGRPADEPLSTITKTGSQQQLVTAHLTSFYGTNEGSSQGDLQAPLGTITAGGFHQGVVISSLAGDDLEGARRVARFLKRYYKPGKKDPELLADPETGVLTVLGRRFQMVDISLRMMSVGELKLCQGFPADYRLDPVCEYRTSKGTKFGRLPQSEQVAKIGNSVCPQVARALAEANLYHERLDQLPRPKSARAPRLRAPRQKAA